jgi:hypothetical protein
MKKSCLLFVFIFSCWALFAQNKENKINFEGCKDCRISEGYCYAVIESLRVSQGNDSIAIEIFKKEYKIVKMPYYKSEWLLKKNHIEIIQFYTMKENKKYYCRSKIFTPHDRVLLIN